MITKVDEINNKLVRILFGPMPVSARILAKVFSQLPEDAVMTRHIEDPARGAWGWIIASSKFRSLKEGEIIPEAIIRFDSSNDQLTLTLPTVGDDFMKELSTL